MPYYVQKSGTTWRLTWRFGKEKPRSIAKDSAEAKGLGLSPAQSFDEAKASVQSVRDREELDREAKARGHVAKAARVESAFLPKDAADEFEAVFLAEYKIRAPHWATMQKVIAGCKVHPSDWVSRRRTLIAEFERLRCSANYAKKLLRYLNFWGYFLCKRENRPFLPVTRLAGAERNRLEAKRRPGGPSKELTPELLKKGKDKLSEAEYRWVFVSLWFGLRPEEVDNLATARGELWNLAADEKYGWVLSVLQVKLVLRGTPKEQAWKQIPTIFPEQKTAVKYLTEGGLQRPVGAQGKGMRAAFGPGYTHYAGRNGFVKILYEAGYSLHTRQAYLGHLNVSTTQGYDRKVKRREVVAPSKKSA